MSDVGVCVGLFVFYAAVLVAPVSYWLAALMLLAAVAVARPRPGPPEVGPALVATTITACLLVGFALVPFLVMPVSGRGLVLVGRLSVLPITAAAFWKVRSTPLAIAGLWLGATAASFLAAANAVSMVTFGSATRAEGMTGNAIIFGDLVIVTATLSVLLGPLSGLARRIWLPVTVAAAGAGLLAATLSGSRGSWLAVPFIGALVARHYRPARWVRRATIAAVAGVIALATVMAGGMPLNRASAAVGDVSGYVGSDVRSPSAGTSVGARLEAWWAAIDGFVAHPISGLGWGNIDNHFASLVESGVRNPRIAGFDHAHNEFLGALANGGIAGLATLTAMLVVPGWYFWRSSRSDDTRERSLGAAGFATVIAFVIFALTEAIFESLVPITFYAITIAALASQLTPSAPAVELKAPPLPRGLPRSFDR